MRRVCCQKDLSASDLTEADLSGSVLNGPNFRGANLYGTAFTRADLSEANLFYANLFAANVDAAKIISATLTAANLTKATIARADLTRTGVSGTAFAGVDLSSVIGLETVVHWGLSTIGIDTIYKSRGKIPETFLRGCGVPENFIAYVGSMVGRPIEYYSCFISYSTKDQGFADRLYADLQAMGVRCWFAPHDIKGGRKLHEQIDDAIRLHDRVLLILSEHSMASVWVKTELAKARNREVKEGKRILVGARSRCLACMIIGDIAGRIAEAKQLYEQSEDVIDGMLAGMIRIGTARSLRPWARRTCLSTAAVSVSPAFGAAFVSASTTARVRPRTRSNIRNAPAVLPCCARSSKCWRGR